MPMQCGQSPLRCAHRVKFMIIFYAKKEEHVVRAHACNMPPYLGAAAVSFTTEDGRFGAAGL